MMVTRIVTALGLAILVGCGSTKGTTRYLIDAPASEAKARLSVRSLELRDVSLPGHASGSEILVTDESGAVLPLAGAVWADDPQRAVTSELARAMDLGSTATVVVEPWPLPEPPDARLEVRIERMLARSSGVFELSGQAAVSSGSGSTRDRVERFQIAVPLTDLSGPSVSDAAGRSLSQLAQDLLEML